MRYALLALLVLVAPIPAHAVFLDCLFFDGFENPGTTDAASLRALQIHNCARKTVIPAANPTIPMMSWDASLATTAQTLAEGCLFTQGGSGQYVSPAPGSIPTFADAALAWTGEQPHYDYASNTCVSGQRCGDYTQMVWRSTTQMGCGQSYCTTNSPFGSNVPNWYFTVCVYNPPGNNGQLPY